MSALYTETLGADRDAAPLVLLHGWALNLRVFDALTASLAPNRRVLRIDLPGHGRSPWDPGDAPFERQLELLGAALPGHCDLLGWSLGGLFALALAARTPARIGKLVLVSSTPRFESGADWSLGMATPVVEKFASTLLADYARGVQDFLELQVRGARNAEASLQQLHRALLTHGVARSAALAAGLAILRHVDLRAQLAQISAPTLSIAGERDRIAQVEAARFIAAQIPGARSLVLRRAAHAPFLSHAHEFCAAVYEFLG